MQIFISGTTVEFLPLRRELVELLSSFEHVRLNAVSQENLAPDTSLVTTLIGNVLECELVLCLIGDAGGFPRTPNERREVQALAEHHLQKQLKLPPKKWGRLWNEWRKLNQGMTYTQLEAFLAFSVFSEPTPILTHRLHARLYLLHGETSLIDDQQRQYIQFLNQFDGEIDWRDGKTDVKLDAVRLSVEFALRLRDDAQAFPLAASPNEALRQRLVSVRDDARRQILISDSYANFYREVWQRSSQTLNVLCAHSDVSQPLPLNRLRDPALVAKDEHFITVVVRCREALSILTYPRNELNCKQVYRLRIESGTQVDPVSVSADGAVVLARREGKLEYYHRDNTPVLAPSSLTIDTFADRLPAMVEREGEYWVVNPLPNGNYVWTPLTSPGEARDESLAPQSEFPYYSNFREDAVSRDRRGSRAAVLDEIYDDGITPANDFKFELLRPQDPEQAESIRRLQHHCLPVIDLFRISKLETNEGHFLEMYLRFERDGLYWVIDCNGAAGEQITVDVKISNKGCDQGAGFQALPHQLAREGFERIQFPGEDDETAEFPYLGQYAWSESGEFLLAVESKKQEQGGFIGRAWRFPRPIDQGVFADELWQILEGRRPFSPGDPGWESRLRQFSTIEAPSKD